MSTPRCDEPGFFGRRRLLQTGAGALLAGGGAALGWLGRDRAMAMEPGHHGGSPRGDLPVDPQQTLRSFSQGRLIEENGRRLRLFEVEARSITLPLAEEVRFKAWSLDGRVPGPTLRARQGERLRVVFQNGDST
ncbi:MAG: copper oxidase, partial [Cyanobacteriota bacterium]